MRGAPPQPQDKGNEFLEAALLYAEKMGWKVLPLKPRGKEPETSLVPHGVYDATTDPDKIRSWWAKVPDANVGIVCGGGLVVLDYDPRHGGRWEEDPLPLTPMVLTGGGGAHFYFSAPKGIPKRKVGPGIDLLGEGSIVVAPPSIHPSGRPYKWGEGRTPFELRTAPFPDWTRAIADQSGVKHYTMTPPIPEGYRYHYAVSLMGFLLAKGADIEKVTDFILANREWLFEQGKSPFTEREIRAIGRWLSKKAPGRPVSRWQPVLEKAGVAKQVIEAWASYIGEPIETPEPERTKGGKMTREKIAKLLEAAEWVKFRGEVWLTHKGQLYALSEAHEYVYDVSGRTASQQTAKEVAMAMRRQKAQTAKPIDRAVVLYDEAPIFGRAAGYEGVWLAAEGKIWVVTKDGYKTWPLDEPPAGVYYRPDRVLPLAPVLGPEGVKEFRIYWGRQTKNLDEGEYGPELSLAALAPVLLGLCRLGVFFTGEKGSGKSTAARAALYIVYGRDPITGMGDTHRDRLSAADADRIFYADDIDITDAEMQKLMRIGLTGGRVRVRKLYEDKKTEVMAIDGSYFLCGIEAKGLRADTLERFISLQFSPKVRIPESKVMDYFAENWHKALGGLLTLYQMAASLPEPDLSAWGWVRMQDWLSWAFRFAVVLRKLEEFQNWVIKVRGAAMEQAKFGELAKAIVAGRIKEGVAYKARTLAEILWPDLAMGGEKGKKGQNPLEAENALYRKERAISSPSGRKALADIAQSCGLRLRMQKVGGADGYWEYVFEKAAFEQGWEVPENTLEALADTLPTPQPMALASEPLHQSDPVPIPEALGEGIAPQTLDTYLKATDGIRELPLHIEETAKAVKRLAELLGALSQSEVKPLRQLSLYLRGLQALTYAEIGAYNGAIMYLGGTPKHPTPKEALGVLQQVIRDIEGSLNGEEVALAPLPIPPQSGGRTALPTPPTPEIAEKHRAIEEIRRAIRELERAIKGDDPTDPTPTDPDHTPPSPIGPDPTPNPPPREGEPKWEYVTDASRLPEIEERLQREDAVGWDLETANHDPKKTGALHPTEGRARLFSLYLPTANTAYLIDLDRVPEAWGLLAKAKKIVGHNLLFDLTFAAAYGAYIANPKERLWDTMIAEKLLDCKEYSEPRRHSLKELASELGIWLNKEHQTANWGGPLTDEMRRYAAMDAYAPYLVYLSQRERIAKEGLGKAMAIEMGALPAIAAMRAWGVGVDGDAVKRDWDAHLAEVERLEKKLEPYGREVEPSLNLGERLNWNRLELIKKVLQRHGLPADKTNEEALAPYKDHPFVATLLKWREVTKRGKLLAGLLEPARRGGRIYADWDPLGAGTGRMTCESPNLQQTPHELRAHIKPREGHVFIKADFSQIELRIAAVVAKDRRMLQAFRDGTDLHALTASLILSKETKQVSKEERQMAKALNFGLLYGMGAEGLKNYAQSEYGVSLSLRRAVEYRQKFFATYPGLAKWHRETERKLIEAKNRGERGIVVSTLAGRQRWVYTDELTAALNTPIQGTGADGLKSAVAVFYKWLLERGLWGQVRIVLLVHDEIVVEAPEPLALEAADLLTEAMREGMGAIVNKAVPIEVEAGIYADWGQTPHRLNEAWGRFAKIPVGHPVREAILKGEAPDPERDGEYLTTHMIIRDILNGENIEPPF
jgi:DNA polymerase-1